MAVNVTHNKSTLFSFLPPFFGGECWRSICIGFMIVGYRKRLYSPTVFLVFFGGVCLDAFHRTHMPLGIAEDLPLLGDVFLGQVDLVLDVELAEGF